MRDCLLRHPSTGYHRCPFEDNDQMEGRNRKLQGIGLNLDKKQAILCCSVIVHGNNMSFQARLKEDRRESSEPQPSTKLARMYPEEKPYQAEQGGWLSLFDNLDPLIGLAFNPNDDDSILTDHKNGVLVSSGHTIEKLKQSNMPRDVIVDCTPFAQFIGPSN